METTPSSESGAKEFKVNKNTRKHDYGSDPEPAIFDDQTYIKQGWSKRDAHELTYFLQEIQKNVGYHRDGRFFERSVNPDKVKEMFEQHGQEVPSPVLDLVHEAQKVYPEEIKFQTLHVVGDAIDVLKELDDPKNFGWAYEQVGNKLMLMNILFEKAGRADEYADLWEKHEKAFAYWRSLNDKENPKEEITHDEIQKARLVYQRFFSDLAKIIVK